MKNSLINLDVSGLFVAAITTIPHNTENGYDYKACNAQTDDHDVLVAKVTIHSHGC